MKRIIVIAIVFIFVASVFFFVIHSNQPKEGDVQTSLCKANVYSNASLTGSVEILSSLSKGDSFTLTGAHKSASNGKGATYTMWEGTTADGTRGWVKANAFISTDYHG